MGFYDKNYYRPNLNNIICSFIIIYIGTGFLIATQDSLPVLLSLIIKISVSVKDFAIVVEVTQDNVVAQRSTICGGIR